MKTALTVFASLAFVACSAGTPDPGNTTTTTGGDSTTTTTTTSGGNGTTGSSTTTTTTTSGTGTTTGTSTTGGTTGPVYTGACRSNAWTCADGTARAGQIYPANSPANCGSSPGQTFPDLALQGGGIMNFGATETMDDVSAITTDAVSFHDLFCSGYDYVFVDVSARWCIHCKEEAQQIPGWTGSGYASNSLTQAWLDKKGLVFSVLVQSNTSDSATMSDLTYWINYYKIPYSMSLDSNQDLAAGLSLAGWPENIIINLSNMQVIDTVPGATSAFYQEYCNILGVSPCPTN